MPSNRNVKDLSSSVPCLEDWVNSSVCCPTVEVKKCIAEHYGLFGQNQIRKNEFSGFLL